MPVKHAFASGRGDTSDPGEVQPSHWNADHQLTGMLALLDALAPTPNVTLTLDGTGQFSLLPTNNFAPAFSPVFTGVPTAPTPDPAVNSNQIATMAALHTAITNLIGGAPGALDTLKELADAIGDDASYAGTITTALSNRLRVDAVQSFSGGQKTQGLQNLGAASSAPIFLVQTADTSIPNARIVPDTTSIKWDFATAGQAKATVVYTQPDTGAVASPMIKRFENTLFASEFQCVGDDNFTTGTNDQVNLNRFLAAVAASGKEGRFDHGKKYYVSGADLLFAPGLNIGNSRLIGNGAVIRTDPSQGRYGLKIQPVASVTRFDQGRQIVVEDLSFYQYQDANALGAIQVNGASYVTLNGITVTAGADNATVPNANYAAVYIKQRNVHVDTNPASPTNDNNTGSYWVTIDGLLVYGGATKVPKGILSEGANNALLIRNSKFNATQKCVHLSRAYPAANSVDAAIANAVTVDGGAFEDYNHGVYVDGVSANSTLDGFIMKDVRSEVGTVAQFYNTLDKETTRPPRIKPGYCAAGTSPPVAISTNNLDCIVETNAAVTVSNVGTVDIAIPKNCSGVTVRMSAFDPVTTGQDLIVLASTNYGVSYDTTAANYAYAGSMQGASGPTSNPVGSAGAFPVIARAQTKGYFFASLLEIMPGGGAAGDYQALLWRTSYRDSTAGTPSHIADGGAYLNGARITNIRLKYATGNIDQGTYIVEPHWNGP